MLKGMGDSIVKCDGYGFEEIDETSGNVNVHVNLLNTNANVIHLLPN